MIYTKYSKENGAILGYREITGEPIIHENALIGVWPGRHDADTLYFAVSGEPPVPRELVTGLSANKTTILANGIDQLVISNLPLDCWLNVNGAAIHVTTGTYTFTATANGIVVLKLIGKYYTNADLYIKVITLIENARENDIRWTAVKTATPAEIDTWINNNIIDLPSARNLLKALVLAVRALHDKIEGPNS